MVTLTDTLPVLPADQGPRTVLLARSRWRMGEYLFWLAVIASYFVFGGYVPGLENRHQLMSEIAILALFALSLDLILGYAGIVSLGHGAFFGIGAYAAALAAKYGAGAGLWSDPFFGLLIGAGAAGIVGFATSFLVLRGSDLTRLMVTLGVALIVEELGNDMKWLTGGSDGLQGVMPGPVLGHFDFDLYGNVAFIYAVVVLFIVFYFVRRLTYAPFGISLRAIKGNALRSRSIGMPVNPRLVAVYTIGTTIAGIAGALLAETTQFASLDMLAFHRSADTLLILVFGGAGRLYGGLVGAVVFRVMQDRIGNVTPQYWEFWLGLLLVLLVLFVRGGLLGLMDNIRARITGGAK
jgi:branched-chain amino acid transport system permease protein